MTIREFNRRKRERERLMSMLIQKLAGVVMILLGILATYVASKGVNPVDTDCCGALFIMLIGVVLVFCRDHILG